MDIRIRVIPRLVLVMIFPFLGAACERTASLPFDIESGALRASTGASTAPVRGLGRPEWLYSTSPGETGLQRFNLLRPHHEFPLTGVNNSFGLAVDNHHDVYVVTNNEVDVFDSSLSQPAKRTFTFDSNYSGFSMAVDARRQVYVDVFDSATQDWSVQVFAAGATGAVTPIREIAGPATQVGYRSVIALDSDGTLYVGNYYHVVLVFPPRAHGNVAPVRTISSSFNWITDLAIGGDGNLYVSNSTGGFFGEIVVVPKTASGVTEALWTLDSRNFGWSIALGPDGTMYLGPNALHSDHIAVFAPGASGDAKPIGFVGKGVLATNRLALADAWVQP
jgi:hypothetical protein